MHIETKIIKQQICTFTSSYIKNMWQGCEVKTVHKIKKLKNKLKVIIFNKTNFKNSY